jgi:Fungal specific transcription factor domain
MKYFNFFLGHTRALMPYTDMFPEAISQMFARATLSKPLLHAVLAVGSRMADISLKRDSPRSVYHKREAVVLLKRNLVTNDIDENMAIALFLILFMDTFSGREVAHAHLRGLHLVLRELGADTDDNHPMFWGKLSPLLLLVWRIAMRIDSLISTIQREAPIFPPFPQKYNTLQRSWTQLLTNDSKTADFAIAAFAIDNLYLRATHFSRNFERGRLSLEYLTDPTVQQTWDKTNIQHFKVLIEEHATWLELPACTSGLRLELMAQQDPIPCNAPRFLDYPPKVVNDRTFVLLLNEWRTLYLVLNVISMPLHLKRHSITSMNHAIEICRTHAALQIPRLSTEWSPEIFTLIAAMNAFAGGKQYKNETKWMAELFADIKEMRVPLLTMFQDFLDKIVEDLLAAPEWDEVDLQDWWDLPIEAW